MTNKQPESNMAESESIAQIVVMPDKMCELCDENDITWQCLDCNELICDRCKAIHLKSKVAKNHKVINLKGFTEADKRLSRDEKQNTKCSNHTTEDLQLYCMSCDMPVCRQCVASTSHQAHSFSIIENMIDSKQSELSDILVQSWGKVDKYEFTVESVSTLWVDFDIEISKRIDELNIRNEGLKKKFDKITSNFVEMLNDDRENKRRQTTEFNCKIESELAELRKLVQECENKRTDRNIELFQFVTDMKTQLDKYNPCNAPEIEKPPKLMTRNVDDEELKVLFGDLVKETPDESHNENTSRLEYVIDVLLTFSANNITHVVAVDRDQAWIWPWTGAGVSLVTTDGKVARNIKTDFGMYDAAVTKSDDLLLTPSRGKKVKRVTSDGALRDVYKAHAGYETRGITVTNNGDVIVVLFKYKSSKLAEITTNGRLIRTIQYDTIDHTTLFDSPSFISTNINGDILVKDGMNKVVVVDQSGHKRFIYDGEGKGLRNPFNPQYIATDLQGRVIISDNSNSLLHMLDKDGNFLQFIVTKRQGLLEPKGLSIDKNGGLWVCNAGNGKIMKFVYS